jgi:hypothetical protein
VAGDPLAPRARPMAVNSGLFSGGEPHPFRDGARGSTE